MQPQHKPYTDGLCFLQHELHVSRVRGLILPTLAASTTEHTSLRDFGLQPRRKRDTRCSGMLRGVDWLFTDVSGQHIGPIFAGKLQIP
jgi:hypothetical protein